MTTPTPPEDLPGYDTLPWPDDVLAVWIEASDSAKAELRQAWPDLTAALDRQAEVVMSPDRRRPRWATEPRRPVPWEKRGER